MRNALPLAVLVTALTASAASAVPVFGTNVGMTLTGTRDNLVVGGQYDSNTSVTWEITPLGGNAFTYTYQFIGFTQRDISHVILSLTPDALDPFDLLVVTGTTYNGNSINQNDDLEFGLFGPGGGNPGFPAGQSILGVKFDDTPGGDPFTISFTSNRAPVWGDVYLKGGTNSFAYNPGLELPNSTDILDFVARPNGVIPEPSSLALCGTAALLGLGLARRRIRRKS